MSSSGIIQPRKTNHMYIVTSDFTSFKRRGSQDKAIALANELGSQVYISSNGKLTLLYDSQNPNQ